MNERAGVLLRLEPLLECLRLLGGSLLSGPQKSEELEELQRVLFLFGSQRVKGLWRRNFRARAAFVGQVLRRVGRESIEHGLAVELEFLLL